MLKLLNMIKMFSLGMSSSRRTLRQTEPREEVNH